MTTPVNVAESAARKAVFDTIASRIHTLEAQLAMLKAKAESAKADTEVTAIAKLATAKQTLDLKFAELKSNGAAAFDQVRADVERRVAEFDKSLQSIATRINPR